MSLPRCLLIAAFFSAHTLAQQPGSPAKTTEQQARSYVASAFITGAAPAIMGDKVTVSPALQQRLGLEPGASGAAVYKALMEITSGKPVQVRRAAMDEVAQSEAPAPVSEQPVFTVESGNSTFLVQYDLVRDSISFVGLPGAVATAAPVMAPVPPQKVAETPAIAEAPKPAPAPKPVPAPVAAPPPAPAPVPAPVASRPAMAEAPKPAVQVVEPQIPRASKPAAPVVAARPAQPAMPMEEPRPLLRKSGPCEIKPVMSDQDLVNCGATPR